MPVPAQLDTAVAPPEPVGRRDPLDVAEGRRGRGHVLQRQELIDGIEVRLSLDFRVLQDGLDLGAEDDASAGQARVVKRLLAHAVARQEQRTVTSVPDRQREHATELLEAALPLFLV